MRSSSKHNGIEAILGALVIVCQTGCGDPDGAYLDNTGAWMKPAVKPTVVSDVDAGASANAEPTDDVPAGSGATPKPAAAGNQAPAPVDTTPVAGKPAAVSVTPRRTTTSYQRDIRPVIESSCVSCHSAGNASPTLDSWDSVHAAAGAVVDAVAAGRMPPWPADDSCHALRDSRALPKTTRDLFTTWGSESYPQGATSDYVPQPSAAVVSSLAPTYVLDAGSTYTPPANTDNDRCFLTTQAFDKDTYINAVEILPDQAAEIRDIQIHAITPDQRTQLLALDLLNAGTGHNCNIDLGLTQNMFGWEPGSSKLQLDPSDGVYMAAGSTIMLQVHYNTQYLENGAQPTPDQSKVKLWMLPEGQVPDRVVYRQTIVVPVTLAKDDPYKVVESTVPFNLIANVGPTKQYIPGEIIGMSPHAHQLATQLSANMIPEGGIGDQCLVDVQAWQPGWQLDYLYQDAVPYTPNDSVHSVCVYNNSAENQPTLAGVKQPSISVQFGERPLNETCIEHVWLRMDRRAFLGQVPASSVGEVPVPVPQQSSL
jgi:Copper type II ascorbate-dependent monooxygenase, C-terminal domain